MVRMFVRHTVASYNAWRKVYDSVDAERKKAGVLGHGVYQAVGDRNDVTVYHDFSTRRRAESFAASKLLKEAMKAAGVKGRPKIWFVNEAKKPTARRPARRPARRAATRR